MRYLLTLLFSASMLVSPRTIALETLPSRPVPMGAHCMLLMAQTGNPGHVRPAPGDNCTQDPKSNDPDKACKCHRECKDEEELGEDGIATGKKITRLVEDAQCSKFCYADHCHCPIHNCE